MDMLARELDMDPAELRRKNFIQPDQFPYKTQMGAVYDSGDYEKALDHALEVAGWERLKQERDAARADGRLACGTAPRSTSSSSGSRASKDTSSWPYSITSEKPSWSRLVRESARWNTARSCGG